MNFLIDSDVISALTSPDKPEHQKAINFINSFEPFPKLHLSILTVLEIEFNIASFKNKDDQKKLRSMLEKLQTDFEILHLDFEQARIYGELKTGFLHKTGINKNALKRHNIDIALASVAITNDCILVSQDKIYPNHLQDIDPRLQYKNWME